MSQNKRFGKSWTQQEGSEKKCSQHLMGVKRPGFLTLPMKRQEKWRQYVSSTRWFYSNFTQVQRRRQWEISRKEWQAKHYSTAKWIFWLLAWYVPKWWGKVRQRGSFSSSNQKEEREQNKQARSSQRVGTTRKRIFNVMFKRIEWSSGFGGQSLVPSRGGQASWCLDHKSQTGLEQLDLCCGGPTWRGKHWTKT